MAKRQIEFDDKPIKFAVWAVTVAFGLYFTANSLYVEHPEAKVTQADLIEKIELAEADRYAEVAEHYRIEGFERNLTSGERFRYNLVVKAECRINAKLESQTTEDLMVKLEECKDLTPVEDLPKHD